MTSFSFLFFISGSTSYFLMRLFVTKITTGLSKSEPRPIGTATTAIPEAAISSESGARNLPGVTPDTQARPFLDAAALMAYRTSSDITTPPTLYVVLAAFLYGFIGGPQPFLFGALAGGFSSTCFRPSERLAPSFNELKYLLEAKIRGGLLALRRRRGCRAHPDYRMVRRSRDLVNHNSLLCESCVPAFV